MGQGGCERRIEVFVKIPKKKLGGRWVREVGRGRGVGLGGGRRWVWGGGQGGCERRIEVFVKIQKKKWGGGGWGGLGFGGGGGGGQGGCEELIKELKFLGKFTKKKIRGWGVRVDLKDELKFL